MIRAPSPTLRSRKNYGLRQTIADTLGIGGIMRALRTIPVMEEFARDMEEVCPNTLFLNYTNPMAMLTGYMQRYTKIRTVGLCHSVQVCSEKLLEKLGMEDKLEGRRELIAGINHMGWLLELHDKDGNDLYPEIRRRAAEKNSWNIQAGTDGSVSTRGWEVYPCSGAEDYFEPAFAIQHNDGNMTSIFKYVSSESKKLDNNVTETIISLKDDVYPVEAKLHYVTFAKENVIKAWTEIRHMEKKTGHDYPIRFQYALFRESSLCIDRV